MYGDSKLELGIESPILESRVRYSKPSSSLVSKCLSLIENIN